MAAKFVLEKDPAGRFRFRLVSQGRVLATSESYTTKRAAQNAIASVKSGASSATVDDTTQPAAPERAPGRPVKAVEKAVEQKLESAVKAVKAVRRRRTASAPDAIVAPTTPPVAKKRAPRKASATKKASANR